MGDDRGPLRRRQSGIGRAVPEASPIDPAFLSGDRLGGVVMNTAMSRRLALGDRVIWTGKEDCQPSGPGTITRITAHQVEVKWEGEIARRYRRTQLHNLRHVKLFSAAADSFVGVCVASPAAKQNQNILLGQGL
jgi:hypothetical protein